MRSAFRSSASTLAGLILFAGLVSCSSDGGDPVDPGPDHGAVRVTVTGDGTALPGVTARLFADGGGTAITSAATAANGQVTFADLNPASYDVDVVLPTGFELAAGQTARRDVVVQEDQTATVTFALQEIVVAPTEGSIRVDVADGAGAVAGVQVMLFTSGGDTPLETLATAANGRVLFDGLAPGAYDVEIDVPDDHELAAGEEIRKAATVTAGVTSTLDFELVSTLPAVVEITATGAIFSDTDVTVTTGTVVRWIKGTNTHSVTPDGHSEWTSVILDTPGETFEHTFDSVGTFDYLCEFHDGMTGVIRVQ